MHNLEAAFLADIKANPHDWLPRLVFADWLEEQGDPRAELIRLSHDLTRLQCEDRSQKEARLQELREAGVQWPTPKLENGLGMEFVLIPPGEFLMGSAEKGECFRDGEPQVEVCLTQGYWLGQRTVTQHIWESMMGTVPWYGEERSTGGSKYPAVCISWDDATEFCYRLTQLERWENRLPPGWKYTLPTETQWEYACRAGTTTGVSYVDVPEYSILIDSNWFVETSYQFHDAEGEFPQQVGKGPSNNWNLHDLPGSILEWCQDWSINELLGGTDPIVSEPTEYRVCRGGNWIRYDRNKCSALRCMHDPASEGNIIGFRVACVPVD